MRIKGYGDNAFSNPIRVYRADIVRRINGQDVRCYNIEGFLINEPKWDSYNQNNANDDIPAIFIPLSSFVTGKCSLRSAKKKINECFYEREVTAETVSDAFSVGKVPVKSPLLTTKKYAKDGDDYYLPETVSVSSRFPFNFSNAKDAIDSYVSNNKNSASYSVIHGADTNGENIGYYVECTTSDGKMVYVRMSDAYKLEHWFTLEQLQRTGFEGFVPGEIILGSSDANDRCVIDSSNEFEVLAGEMKKGHDVRAYTRRLIKKTSNPFSSKHSDEADL